MARSHGKLLVSIWRDADFLAHTEAHQRLYMVLLSQPQLSLVGCIDLALGRWSRLAADSTRERTEANLEALADGRFVVIDGDTDELLIRTLVAHDFDPNRMNRNLAKGLWGAWGCVESPALRSIIVHEMPDAVWEKAAEHAPIDAEETRRSARLEPKQRPRFELGEPPRSEPLPPPSSRSPLAANRPDERHRLLCDAAAIIGDRAALRPGVGNPAACAKAVARGITTDRYQDAYAAIAADPSMTPQALADFLEPPAPPHPLDRQAQAERSMAERNHRRLNGTACPTCQDVGTYLDDEGFAHKCNHLQLVPEATA